MTHKEIFEALLAGKRLTYATSQIKPGERWIVLNGEHLWDQDLRLPAGILLGESWMNWQLYEEPNPHTPGTFPWAREEAKRGKFVRRARTKAEATNPSFKGCRDSSFRSEAYWRIEDLDATDWEAVP